MNEENKNEERLPEELSDILLVLDKKEMKIKAVTGKDKDGNLKTVDPSRQNENQFMRVDRGGDLFSNFFSNFFSQLKNPSRFSFFKVPSGKGVETAEALQKHIDAPSQKGAELLDKHAITEPKNLESTMATTQNVPTGQQETTGPKGNKYDPEKIDWETLNNLGLNKDRLEKLKVLDPLLKGYKTNVLVPVSINLGTAVLRTDARLSLQPGENEKTVVAIHGVRREPELQFPFLGHEFTKEDKANLLNTGNMGRIVDLKNPKTGNMIPSIISIDHLTNELVALRSDLIKIPDELKGVKLNEEQKQTLKEGKPLFVEGMISKKDEPFSATVQFNADKRYVEFLFDKSQKNGLSQNGKEGQSVEAPKEFRGTKLTDEQYGQFRDGQTVFVKLVDKKQQPYEGYITFNKETGNTKFDFKNPDTLKEKVQLAENNKTQVAVNNDGKTNESTKNIKEPLKSGQTNPDSPDQKKQQEKKTVKSRKIG